MGLLFRAALTLLGVAALLGAQTVRHGAIRLLGTVSYPVASVRAAVAPAANDLTRVPRFPNLKAALANVSSAAPALVGGNPEPAPKLVIRPEADFSGFAGLTHADSRFANNGNQFSGEPPDQGLAVGNGYVFEAVNSVIAIYNKSASLLAAPVDLNTFYGLAPAIIRGNPNVFGPEVGDPRVYYDQQIQRWFVTSYYEEVDPAMGVPTGPTAVLLAVSQTSNPLGAYYIYAIDTTDDGSNGTPNNPGCPCFPDQPLNGADANGFFITTNEFPVFQSGFNGAQIYATSKQALASGNPGVLVQFTDIPLVEGIAYSVQPARSLTFGSANAEYFLSSLDFFGTLDDRIALWAMLNTDTLANPNPNVKLVNRILVSEVYGMPVVGAAQPPGPTPLATSLGDTEETLSPNDDRMQQVVYQNGLLWSGVNTVAGGSATPLRNGIAWFAIRPAVIFGQVYGAIARQGYVAAPGEDSVLYPSIGVSPSGDAAMTFTLVGPNGSLAGPRFYPSMAFTRLNLLTGAGPIQLGGAGAAPEDGFSGYAQYGGVGEVARWGDYSAAVGDLDGSIWMAAEWIPNTPRTTLANWGTFIGALPK